MAFETVKEDLALDFLAKSGYITEETQVETEETDEDTIDLDSLTEEQVAEHVCPLCESYIEEGISDESLLEHYDNVMAIMNELNESDETLTEQEELVAKAAAYDELVAELEAEKE
jgi:hypothetical protein